VPEDYEKLHELRVSVRPRARRPARLPPSAAAAHRRPACALPSERHPQSARSALPARSLSHMDESPRPCGAACSDQTGCVERWRLARLALLPGAAATFPRAPESHG